MVPSMAGGQCEAAFASGSVSHESVMSYKQEYNGRRKEIRRSDYILER